MSTEQFPPSSPILSHQQDEDDFDIDELNKENIDPFSSHYSLPKKKKQAPLKQNQQQDYPTPNPSSDFPSSSIGLQSPIRELKKHDTSPLKPELISSPNFAIKTNDSKYKFISPMDNVKIIKLQEGKAYKFGRSSKNCDFQLNKLNKSISKIHFEVNMDSQYITIACHGQNGMNMTIPRPSVVKFFGNSPDQYIIEPTTDTKISELNGKGLSTIGRCNQKYDNLTNVLLMKNELVKIPKLKGILLDIWDEFLLLDFDDDDESKEDEDVIVKKIDATEKKVALCYKPTDPMGEDVITKKSEDGFKKPDGKRGRPKSHPPKSPSPQPVEEQQQHKKTKREDTPQPELYHDITDAEVEERLSQIGDLQNIENVLINHLAFSRLSSTPISTLQKISHKTMELTKLDLQLILIKKIKCCGVIYRVGKDAAGKPLEEEYYYQLDLDDDMSRQKLVNDLKGESGNLRSCRKVHKQYFWKKPKSSK